MPETTEGLSPRVRGNQALQWTPDDLFTRGLSPRVRGNQSAPVYPARARPEGLSPRVRGNPCTPGQRPGWCRGLSPRVRGNHIDHVRPGRGERGLSPRVRGNLWPSQWPSLLDGSIPARAGEPWRQHRWRLTGWVYPRACGGTLRQTAIPDWPCQGLSPRVRGNRRAAGVVPGLTPRQPGRQGLSPRVRGNPLAN